MSLGAVSPEELAEMSARNRDGGTELQELVRKGKDGPTDETMERTSTGNKQEKGVCVYVCVSMNRLIRLVSSNKLSFFLFHG